MSKFLDVIRALAAGGITFGSAGDTNLYRFAADTLKTDDALIVGGQLTASAGLAVTGTVTGIAKADVGLGNVDNTSDVNKPVSTAQAAADATKQPLDSDLTAIAALAPADNNVMQRKAGVWVGSTPATVKTDLALVKGDVGLGNVDNTSDVNKPVSTAQAAADATKQPLDSDLTTIAALAPADNNVMQRKAGVWVGSTPATVKTDLALVKGDVGLGSVDNTSDAGKPVSTAQQTALNLKADLAGPTFTGVPAAPTAGAGTSTTQLATTAFVATAVSAASTTNADAIMAIMGAY